MTTALRQQTEIAGQIAQRLAGMPTNHDVVRLLEAAQAHNVADATITGGREGVCGELGNFGRGGAKFFFGPETSTKS